MIRFSHCSKTLQKFITISLYKNGVVSKHAPVLHHFILDKLFDLSEQWATKYPQIKIDKKIKKMQPTYVFRVPSKIFVLHHLLTNTTELYTSTLQFLLQRVNQHERSNPDVLTDRLRKQTKMVFETTDSKRASALQWFHLHAHTILEELSSTTMKLRLNTLKSQPITCIVQLWSSYPTLYDYFVPLNVQQQFEQKTLDVVSYKWNFIDKSYTVETFLLHQTVQSTNAIDHMGFRISMMSFLEGNTCNDLKIRWFPNTCQKKIGAPHTHACTVSTNASNTSSSPSLILSSTEKKQFRPESTSTTLTWNPFQINTGATFRNLCDSVTIWRNEESDKTFLHEMIHGYGWDFDAPEDMSIFVKNNFAVHPDTTILFFEGYVETWATLLNVYMIVVYDAFVGKKKKSPKKTQNRNKIKRKKTKHVEITHTRIHHTILRLLKQEQSFVLFQVAKVLLNSGFQTWDEFFHNGTPTTSVIFQQKTSVFSYFIVRSALLWDIKWFVDNFKCINYNANLNTQHHTWFQQWQTHLLKIYQTESYRVSINNAMNILRDENIQHSSWIHQTMRMTSVERY